MMKATSSSTRRKSSVGIAKSRRKSSVLSTSEKENKEQSEDGMKASPVGEIKETSKVNEGENDKTVAKEPTTTTPTTTTEIEQEKDKNNSAATQAQVQTEAHTISSHTTSSHPTTIHSHTFGGRTDSELVKHLKEKVDVLQADVARRQESYIRRERAYKQRIEELEFQREEMKGSKLDWVHGDKAMQDLKKMHQMVISNVDIVQDRTSKILQEQERDLLRAFRARLFDLQTELDREKKRKDDGAVAWIEKSRKLENELEWIEETADRLDRMNQALMKENNQLKGQFRVQEEDRSYLVKQLVNAKRDNSMMREKMGKMEDQIDHLNLELEALSYSGASKASASSNPSMTNKQNTSQLKEKLQYLENPDNKYNTNINDALVAQGDNILDSAAGDNRYKEVIRKLKRTLELERKNARAVREKYAQELESRSELEAFLRSAIEDIRKQLKSMQSKSNITIDDFTAEDREKAIALLLSQEKVISLLYGKTFPARYNQISNTQGCEVFPFNQESKFPSDSLDQES